MTHVETLLSKLVAFPVLGGESNLSIIHWIQQYLDDHGIASTLVPDGTGQKASLHARIGPAEPEGLILSGHTDVVPVEGQDWSSDPFSLTDKGDGKLYGRGACDMKGFLACCLAAIPAMAKAPLKRPLYLAFSYDEEVGCLAAPDLIEAIKLAYPEGPRYALIGEPSLMQPITGQKGICVFRTRVNGSAGHSSRIRQEVSAVHESARLILWLENKMNQLVEAGHLDARFDPPHSSLHVGKINGGVAHNVIADEASFLWDVRVIPRDRVEAILEDFQAYCQQREQALRGAFPEIQIRTEVYHPKVPSMDTSEAQEVVRLIREASQRHELGAVSYAAEAGQYAEGGFESIICGPGSIAQAHRADEFIEKGQLAKGLDMMHALIRRFST